MEKKYTWLYKFAWSFEVVAAITGLAMAVVFNAPSYVYYRQDGLLEAHEIANLVGGSLPFILIAFAELCKIPLVVATIKSRGLFKTTLFGFATLAAAFITFETVYNGLETTQAQRSEVIFAHNADIQVLDKKIVRLEDQIETAKEYTQEILDRELSAETDGINNAYDKRVAAIEAEIDRINIQFADRVSVEMKPYEEQLAQIDERIEALRLSVGEEGKAREAEIKRVEVKIRTTQRRLTNYEKALLDCSVFSNTCRKTNQQGIDDVKSELNSLNSKLISLSNMKSGNPKLDDLMGQKKQLTKEKAPILRELQKEKDQVLEKPNTERAKADTWLERNLAGLEEKRWKGEERVNSNQSSIDELEQEKVSSITERDEIMKLKALEVNNNLVYRLAGKWFGEHASEVTDEQASIVSNIWNSSIAMVVAIMGPMIASAYYLLNSQQPRKPKSPLRALALAIRSKKRKPVVVEKEIEVEKIVEKEVEIEKVIEKEIIVEKSIVVEKEVEVVVEKPVIKYVPIYTNDPDLIELAKGEISQMKNPDGRTDLDLKSGKTKA